MNPKLIFGILMIGASGGRCEAKLFDAALLACKSEPYSDGIKISGRLSEASESGSLTISELSAVLHYCSFGNQISELKILNNDFEFIYKENKE